MNDNSCIGYTGIQDMDMSAYTKNNLVQVRNNIDGICVTKVCKNMREKKKETNRGYRVVVESYTVRGMERSECWKWQRLL